MTDGPSLIEAQRMRAIEIHAEIAARYEHEDMLAVVHAAQLLLASFVCIASGDDEVKRMESAAAVGAGIANLATDIGRL